MAIVCSADHLYACLPRTGGVQEVGRIQVMGDTHRFGVMYQESL